MFANCIPNLFKNGIRGNKMHARFSKAYTNIYSEVMHLENQIYSKILSDVILRQEPPKCISPYVSWMCLFGHIQPRYGQLLKKEKEERRERKEERRKREKERKRRKILWV